MAAPLTSLVRRSFSTTLRTQAAAAGVHEGGYKPWKMVSLLVAMPAIGLCAVNAFTAEHEHPPEFVPYEHMRLRNKRFPWGDGNKSLFHNSHANALPDGYEEEH